MNGERFWNVVTRGQRLVVPTITEGNRKQGIATTNHVLASGHGWTLGNRAVAIDDSHTAGFGAGATDQQGTQDKANHQSLKACDTHTLRNDCETHPPLPLWWLTIKIAWLRHEMSQV